MSAMTTILALEKQTETAETETYTHLDRLQQLGRAAGGHCLSC
jgi:hypothetical protein